MYSFQNMRKWNLLECLAKYLCYLNWLYSRSHLSGRPHLPAASQSSISFTSLHPGSSGHELKACVIISHTESLPGLVGRESFKEIIRCLEGQGAELVRDNFSYSSITQTEPRIAVLAARTCSHPMHHIVGIFESC